MTPLRGLAALVGASVLTAAGPAAAVVTVYSSQSAFQTALDGSFTLVNFDTFDTGDRLDDMDVGAALLALGVDSVGANGEVVVRSASSFPTSGRTHLVTNGQGFHGTMLPHLAFNFTSPVNGVGGISNNIDFGRFLVYSGENLTGTLLSDIQFGPGAFAGVTSDVAIGSVQITCQHDGDLRCGVYDLQFGTFAPANPIPEPGAWALMIVGFGAVGAALRRRRYSFVRA